MVVPGVRPALQWQGSVQSPDAPIASDRLVTINSQRSMSQKSRVPVFATGHRPTAVRRTPEFRSGTTGLCCFAVSRSRLLVGAYRPEADFAQKSK
jgi:hypothetical protein